MVIVRRHDVGKTHGHAGRDASRAGHRHIQSRVFVAVPHLGPQNLARRRKTDRRLFLQEAVDVAREQLGAGARASDAADGKLGLGDDLGGVALDERLRRQISLEVEVRGARTQTARVANLDDVFCDRLASALKIRGRQIDPFQSQSQPATSRGSSMRPSSPAHAADCRRSAVPVSATDWPRLIGGSLIE